jgi:hypothetical protein
VRARPSERAIVGLLLVAGLLVAGATMLDGIQPNDEGLMLQAASRIAHGQVPYSGFWWFYPPGQPYLLGGLWSVFGPSLLAWRLVRVAADAAVAVLAYSLARRWAPRPLGLAAWLASLLAMVYPTGPHPFPIALALALGALLALDRHPAWAGVLTGLCAVWRIEFAGYLALGILLAGVVRPEPWRVRGQLAARFAAPAAAVAAVLYAPVVAASGIGPAWRLLVRYPLVQFTAYQSLPFPLSHPGHVDTGSLRAFFGHSAENLLLYYLPLVLVIGALAALCALAVRWRRERWPQVATVVFAAGMTHYMVIRPDVFHTAPLAVAASVLIAWGLAGAGAGVRGSTTAEERTRRPVVRALATVAISLAALSLAYTVVEGLDRQRLVLDTHDVALHLPAADGVRVPPEVAGTLVAAVHAVDARVPPGQPIYVIGLRSDLVTAGNPLFYVLADRPNPTRYDIAAPGVLTTVGVQNEIVGVLERRRVALVVRLTDPVTAAREPNRAGRSSGVRILDAYLAARFRPVTRLGSYLLLTRTQP